MKTATINDVMSWTSCSRYTKKATAKLFAGRENVTALNILELDIPAEDKLWIVLREEMLDANILHEFACRCAEEALKLIYNPDPRSIAAIEAKRAWLRGEITDNELAIARASAYVAHAYAASAYAAYAAASASAASASADDAAAQEKQIEILKEIM